MNPLARKVVTFVTLAEFTVLLALSILMLYYAYAAHAGDGGNWATDLLEGITRRQEDVFGLVGAFFLAVPGLFLPLATTTNGMVTKVGKISLCILGPAWVFAVAANVWLVPGPDAPGQDFAPLADASALRLASYVMTYAASVLGLSKFVRKPSQGEP